MSTIEDFKNAPIGATATREETGSRAMKMDDVERCWVTPNGLYLDDEEMEQRVFTIEPREPAPTTAREALDLAWELAHEVKEGQVIPEGARCLTSSDSVVREHITQHDVKIRPAHATVIRTLEPLPDPKPDWLDAPAVLAVHDSYTEPSVWGKHWDQEGSDGQYQSAVTAGSAHWSELRDVVPLYPKGEKE